MIDSSCGRFVDYIPGRIHDESLVIGPIIFVDAFQPMIVQIVQAKLSSWSSFERPNTSFLRLVENRVKGLECSVGTYINFIKCFIVLDFN